MLLGNKPNHKLFNYICRTIIYDGFKINSPNEPKTIIFKLIFFECPGTLDFIFYKISLQKVQDFEKFVKKDPVQKNKKV
jgi:hypothetical protein